MVWSVLLGVREVVGMRLACGCRKDECAAWPELCGSLELIEPDNLTRRLTTASSLLFVVNGERQLQESNPWDTFK